MPYVWLAAAGLLLAAWVVFRRSEPEPLAVFWFAESLIFTANYAVLDLMELYHYRPGILPGLIPDTALGVFLAELGFVGGWALWVVYTMPPLLGAAAGTVAVVALEILFRRWGFFTGYAWKVWHTAVVFPPYFLLIYWFRAVAERLGVEGGWVRTVVRASVAFWWSHFLGMVLYWITGGLMMQVRVLPTWARNQTLGAIVTVGLPLNAAMLWVMAAKGRERLLRLGWSTLGLLLAGQFWVAVGLWRFRAPWDLYSHTAAQVAAICAAALSDDWISRRSPAATAR